MQTRADSVFPPKVFAPTGIACPVGQTCGAGRHATLARRRQHDCRCDVEKPCSSPSPTSLRRAPATSLDAVGLGAAIDYVTRIGMHNIDRYEHELLAYGMQQLATIPGVRLVARPRTRPGDVICAGRLQHRKRWARRSTKRGLPCVPAIIAPSRSCGAWAWRPRCGHHWRFTTP